MPDRFTARSERERLFPGPTVGAHARTVWQGDRLTQIKKACAPNRVTAGRIEVASGRLAVTIHSPAGAKTVFIHRNGDVQGGESVQQLALDVADWGVRRDLD